MSCCGTAHPQTTDKSVPTVGTRSVPVGGGALQQQQFPVSQQPTSHPGITPFPAPTDASSFRPPEVTPPPAAHSMAYLNGTPYSQPMTPPQMVMYTSPSLAFDPNGPLSPLRRPSPTYPTSSGSPDRQNILSTYQSSAAMPSSPPIDEGKVSVSIDFGELRPS